MPVEFASLNNRTKTATAHFDFEDGETLDVALTYKRSGLTPAFVAEMQEMGKDEARALEGLVQALVSLLTDWDMVEDGQPLPITAETLGRFGVDNLKVFWDAIMAGTAPGESNAASSVSI